MNTQDTVHRKSAAELRIRRVMDALEKNNMQAYYAPTCADAVKIAKELLQPGDVISCGGSVTLDETGVMDLMRCGDRRSVLHRLTQRAAMADAAHWKNEGRTLYYI